MPLDNKCILINFCDDTKEARLDKKATSNRLAMPGKKKKDRKQNPSAHKGKKLPGGKKANLLREAYAGMPY
jgi:hypothetical protein